MEDRRTFSRETQIWAGLLFWKGAAVVGVGLPLTVGQWWRRWGWSYSRPTRGSIWSRILFCRRAPSTTARERATTLTMTSSSKNCWTIAPSLKTSCRDCSRSKIQFVNEYTVYILYILYALYFILKYLFLNFYY